MEYDKLVSLLRKKMNERRRSVNLKITGRFPYSVIPQGFAYYSEFNIEDNETLRDFLLIPAEYREFIVIKLLEMYVKVEDVPNNEGVHSRDNPQSSGGYFGAVFAGHIGDEKACLDLNLSPPANEQPQNNFLTLDNQQDDWGYRPDMNFTSYDPAPSWNMRSSGVLDHGGPSGSHHQQENIHHETSRQYDFENELLEAPEPHTIAHRRRIYS
ncbi:uncharacterized protein LOC142179458 isoform X2 [Nicotiana tabacum]|uniref:Uncharacterized protein LOC142179458 isoform X2 n=1 Tax=Nicotiana tabacum TaxID=4097 RepID=A0AC58U887_TOBAC